MVAEILAELALLATERTKKSYIKQGAKEPLFGVATGAMKPLAKKHLYDQCLANDLYATGNFDAMYLAGMIANPNGMDAADYNRWMESAYFFMVSDYIVAVTLAEADIGQDVADNWIKTDKELYVSAGYSCYAWMLGNRLDNAFDRDKIKGMLEAITKSFDIQPLRVQYAMDNFVGTVGVSYLPLHDEAVKAAEVICKGKTNVGCNPNAKALIAKAAAKNRLGFKRKNVRC